MQGRGIMGADTRAKTARQNAKKAARAAIGQRRRLGRSAWKDMVARRSRPQQSANASMAVMAGWDSMLPMQDTGEHAFGCDPQGA